MAELFERVEMALRGECPPVRAIVSTPPQHGKTLLIEHGLLRVAERFQNSRNAYISFGISRGHEISDATRWLAEGAGHRVEGSKDRWRLENGATIYWTGIGGPLTGKTIDGLLVIDDPHKDREEADSPVIRQKVIEWYEAVPTTRIHSRTSIIVVQTRWHPDDLYGVLALRDGWDVINLPALNDGTDPRRELGEALAEWLHSREKLEGLRSGSADAVGEYQFASLYQGQPRPKGSELFGEPTWYDELPKHYRVFYGCDLAYTAKTYADFSVSVRLLESDGKYYVHDVQRRQCDAVTFARTLIDQVKQMPGPILWHCATSEKGAAQFMQSTLGTFGDIRKTPLFQFELATTDKFQRAQPAAAAWGTGRILVPAPYNEATKRGFNVPWLNRFLSEVRGFTGVADRHDDQVDAMSSAYLLASRRPARRSF